jgi:hypothetical protein
VNIAKLPETLREPQIEILLGRCDVRFTPKSGHCRAAVQCLLCAKSGLVHCSKMLPIRTPRRRVFGYLPRPSVLEALRLMTKSNFVGCKTGRSAGLSPQRIGTETLVSAACVTAAPLRYANNVATNPQAAANISQSPATARLSVAWIK